MKKILYDFVDLVFPNCCPGCNQPFVSGEELLCSSCELDLPLFSPDEDILEYFAGRIDLTDARAFLKFYNQGITQKLLHAIKYKGDRALGEYLGAMFIHHLKSNSVYDHIDVLLPVPLHHSKLKARGYNQSEILAKGMADALRLTVDSTSILRVKKSQTQTKKSRAERWQNVSGIFEVKGDLLKGKHVLLVDDVITTGATLEACAEAIMDTGAASISVAVLAAAM